MKLATVLLVFTRIFCVENRMLTRNYKRDLVTPSGDTTRHPLPNFATEPSSDDDYESVKTLSSEPTEIAGRGNEQSLRHFLEKLSQRMLPRNYKRDAVITSEETSRLPLFNFATKPISHDDYETVKSQSSKPTENDLTKAGEGYEQGLRYFLEKLTEPCAIVVRSNIHPTMQSLFRKYRYDAQGSLIPSSVRYFIKVPQGHGESVLVPLNDNSVSHLGGYVRYYKEVPPIPQAL